MKILSKLEYSQWVYGEMNAGDYMKKKKKEEGDMMDNQGRGRTCVKRKRRKRRKRHVLGLYADSLAMVNIHER